MSRVVPNRELGQHFLVDENILGVIGRLAELGPEDVVLEIGPGLGVLTGYLADRVARVHAVEIDRGLKPALDERLAGRENVELIFGDALNVDLADLDPPPSKLVANLPYQVATPIVVESIDGLPSGRALVRDGAARGRRPFLRPAVDQGLRRGVGPGPAGGRADGIPPRVTAVFRPRPNVDSALVAFQRQTLPANYARREGGRRSRLRPPAQDARQLTRRRLVLRAATRPLPRSRSSAARRTFAPKSSQPPEFVALDSALR